jgi:hypothetical protein
MTFEWFFQFDAILFLFHGIIQNLLWSICSTKIMTLKYIWHSGFQLSGDAFLKVECFWKAAIVPFCEVGYVVMFITKRVLRLGVNSPVQIIFEKQIIQIIMIEICSWLSIILPHYVVIFWTCTWARSIASFLYPAIGTIFSQSVYNESSWGEHHAKDHGK